MTDIAKCANHTLCDLRFNCYRFLASEDPYRQSYISPPDPGVTCDYYIPDREDYMKPLNKS